jgi:hypothetical protein
MRLGKRTAKLVREAMVLGFVEGAWAETTGLGATIPPDREIVIRVLRAARAHPDLYPSLSKVEADLPESETLAWLRQQPSAVGGEQRG